MELHDKELLEFDRIIRMLQDNCQGEANRRILEEDFFRTNQGFAALENQLAEYTDGVAYLHLGLGYFPDCPRREIPDLEPIWERLSKQGLVLELEELLLVLQYLRHVGALQSWYRGVLENLPDPDAVKNHGPGRERLVRMVAGLPLLKDLLRELDFHLDEQGQLREDRIPELRQARKNIIDAQLDLRKSASSIIQANQNLISGDFSTLRDGRMVIPLKTDFKGRIPGLIHQSSASGSTLYVEPFELVDKNNAMNEAEARYHEELQRILRRLSALCSSRVGELSASYDIFLDLDLLLARGILGRQMNAVPCAEGPQVNLLDARHPLLGAKAVPICIQFPENIRMLVISGPNTGGKTVALKTLGLLSLMRQAGMEIPAVGGSTLPRFTRILADIGDEQSISQNLSTFSGHLVRIKSILSLAGPDSLVLLDELGSGTDPAEGSALALAVSESLLSQDCMALITSHHGAVKAMAYSQPVVMNASMDFSETEQRPTYRVIPGVPGQSHALDTAQRLGMPEQVMIRARQLMSGNKDVVEEMLQRLVAEERSQRELRAELSNRERRLDLAQSDILGREARLKAEQAELAREQNRQESLFLTEARSKVEKLLMELSSYRKNLAPAKPSTVPEESAADMAAAGMEADLKTARGLMKELGENFDSRRSRVAQEKPLQDSDSGFQEGGRVRLIQSGMEGELQTRRRDGTWEVLVKGKRMSFKESQFEAMAEQDQNKNRRAKPSYTLDSSMTAVFSMDVRGMRALEARDAVIRQLDAACVQGMGSFSIIHGKGEGKLQVALAELLKSSPAVERFEFARPEDGGSGKTLVYLRY